MTMTNKCTNCGRSTSQVIADAKALGLLQEFQFGLYSCCQISEWLAWSYAADENANYADGLDNGWREEFVLVPVRFHRPQVPWYRDTDDLN